MLGSNVPTVGGIVKGFKTAKEWDCECIQIYTTLSRRWEVTYLPSEKIEEFKEEYEKSNVHEVVAHIPFLVNLASSNKELREKSRDRILIEMTRALDLNIKNLVLHPGSCTVSSKSQGLTRIIEGLNDVFNEFNGHAPSLLLETMAGQGNTLGSTFDELHQIITGVKKNQFLGVCLDTCHIFAAGYDISTEEKYDQVLTEFDRLINLTRIGAIHLNDSLTELGSKKDRHQNIGEGFIGEELFRILVNDERFRNIPKIIEIPKRDTESKGNLDRLRSYQM